MRRKSISSGSVMPDAGILHRPDDAAHHARGDLEAGRIVVGRELARLLDRELRAEPVGALGMAHEERAQLVHAFVDFIHQDPVLGLRFPVLAGDLVVRQHRVVAGVVGVVAGRAVHDLALFAHGEIVRDRDRLAVGDEEAVIGPLVGRPRAHLDRHARAGEVDRRAAAEVMAARRRRENASRACPSRARTAAGPRSRTRPPTRCSRTRSAPCAGWRPGCRARRSV